MVNRIETNIKQSANYVEKAKVNTEQAVTYQQKARKVRYSSNCIISLFKCSATCDLICLILQKKIWIAVCLAIIILILIISLIATFGSWDPVKVKCLDLLEHIMDAKVLALFQPTGCMGEFSESSFSSFIYCSHLTCHTSGSFYL